MEAAVAQVGSFPVSGFWRRFAAFAIDGSILGAVGAVAGLAMFDALAQLGVYGRVFGFAVALLYFGLLNSRLGGGQTIGKRVLSIRAVALDGQQLSVPRSLLRYSVLGIPFCLNNAPLPLEVVMSPWGWLVSLCVFGGLLSIIYLLVFNRKTRRSLHDYAVASWVVHSGAPQAAAQVQPLWRGHVIVVVLLMLVALSVPIAMQPVSQRIPMFADLMSALRALSAEPGIKNASLNAGFTTGSGGQHTFAAATLQLDRSNVDDEAFARRMATRILQVSPKLAERDVVVVSLRYGFDLGIASRWRQHQFNFSPDQLVSK